MILLSIMAFTGDIDVNFLIVIYQIIQSNVNQEHISDLLENTCVNIPLHKIEVDLFSETNQTLE